MSGIAGGPAIGSGWFHDPAGSTNLRWWDGAAWTEHLIDPSTGVAPVAAEPLVPAPVAPPVIAQQPAVAEPVAASAVEQPAVIQPAAFQPEAVHPAVAQPAGAQPAVVQPAVVQPPAAAPITAAPSAQPAVPQALTRRELREQGSGGTTPTVEPPAAQRVVFEPAAAAPNLFEPSTPEPSTFEPAQQASVDTPFDWGLAAAAPTVDAPATPPSATFEQIMAATAPEAPDTPAFGSQTSDSQAFGSQASIAQPAELAPSLAEQSPAAAPYSPSAPIAPAAPGATQTWIAPPPPLEDLYGLRVEDPTYEPMVRTRPPVETAQDVPIGRTSTTAIWVYAVLPLLHFALAWFVYERLKPEDDTGIRWVVLLGPILIYLILAAIDRSRLIANGHTRAPSPLFALIPPLYIGIRAARLGLAAVIPAVVWLVFQVAALAALVMFFPALATHLTSAETSIPSASATPTSSAPLSDTQRAIDLTPTGMAAKITKDFAVMKMTFTSVVCPQLSGVYDGAQTVCVAHLTGGTKNLNISVSASDPHVAFHVVSVGALIPG